MGRDRYNRRSMRYRIPSLNALRIFEAVMRRGSLRQAADELCLTPQAVSQQLKQLEASLSQELFVRGTRSVTPTKAALKLEAYVRRGLDDIAEGIDALKIMRDNPKLHLYVSPYFATYLVKQLGHFSRDHPGLELSMLVGVDMIDLDELEQVDAVINWSYGEPSALDIVPLIEDRKVLVIAPELQKRVPLNNPNDLPLHSLVAPLLANSLWKDALELLDVPARPPKSVLALHTHSAMLEATIAGLGVGFVSHRDALKEIAAGTLIAPFGIDLMAQLPLEKTPRFSLLYKHDKRDSEVLKHFREWLLSYVCQEDKIGYHSRFHRPE